MVLCVLRMRSSGIPGSAPRSVAFSATLPPLGMATLFVDAAPQRHARPKATPHRATMGFVSNGVLVLTYDRATGRFTSLTDETSGATIAFSQEWMMYHSFAGADQNSGASIVVIARFGSRCTPAHVPACSTRRASIRFPHSNVYFNRCVFVLALPALTPPLAQARTCFGHEVSRSPSCPTSPCRSPYKKLQP